MKNILILTMPEDQHALYVKMALATKGHQGVLWYTADFPSLQTHSFELQQSSILWESKGPEFLVNNNNQFSTVWWRRPRPPELPDCVHSEDVENANRENLELYKTFSNVVAPEAFWINELSAAKKANCKLLQLLVAKQSGLTVPETLISNDPRRIKNFILKNNIENTIYKPLYPVVWNRKEDFRITYTREVTLAMLPKDNILQSTAGIFQRKINKAYELRVNFLGDCCISAKLKSQDHPKGKMDWRYIPSHELKVEEYDLPEPIQVKCRALMNKLNLVFGCFDFIVTPDGEYYFLEINEQGQFLWLEDMNPEIKMLDAFTEFLIAGSSDFTWNKRSASTSIRDYYSQIAFQKKHANKLHKTPKAMY